MKAEVDVMWEEEEEREEGTPLSTLLESADEVVAGRVWVVTKRNGGGDARRV